MIWVFCSACFPVSSPTEDIYVVLGGQHTTYVLNEMREQRRIEGLSVPDWMDYVVANIIRPEVPLQIRLQLAGDHQYAQSQ